MTSEVVYDYLHFPDELRELYATAILGDRVTDDLARKESSLVMMLDRAREMAVVGVESLVHADLYSKAGIVEARALQNEVRRYVDMVNFVHETLDNSDVAKSQIEGEQTADEEELRREANGYPEPEQDA